MELTVADLLQLPIMREATVLTEGSYDPYRPVAARCINRRRGAGEYTTPETAPWSLGRWGSALNAVAVVWVLFLTVIFSLPPNELVLWTMLLVGAALALYWRAFAGRRFRGPASKANHR